MEAVIAKRLWSLKEKPSTLPWKGDKGAFRKRARPYTVPIIGLKMHKRFVFLKKTVIFEFKMFRIHPNW